MERLSPEEYQSAEGISEETEQKRKTGHLEGYIKSYSTISIAAEDMFEYQEQQQRTIREQVAEEKAMVTELERLEATDEKRADDIYDDLEQEGRFTVGKNLERVMTFLADEHRQETDPKKKEALVEQWKNLLSARVQNGRDVVNEMKRRFFDAS